MMIKKYKILWVDNFARMGGGLIVYWVQMNYYIYVLMYYHLLYHDNREAKHITD